MANEKCMFCDSPAIAYCDQPIAYEATGCARDATGKVKSLVTGKDAKLYTCDAPLCAEHAHMTGFVCGKDADSIDHCPYHFTHPHNHQRMDELVMFSDEVAKKRSDVYAEINRSLWKIAPCADHSIGAE